MEFEKFLQFLKKWLQEINKVNCDRRSADFIVLDKDYFPYDDETKTYSINEAAISKWKDAEMLFIADNPGKNEKENLQYLYFSNKNENGYFKTAGYKYYKFLDTYYLENESVVKFNKCLLSTSITSKLSADQIKKTEDLVCQFICFFHRAFPNVFLLFSGIAGIKNRTSKFWRLYKKLGHLLQDDNVGFMGHISRKKFPDVFLKNSGCIDELKSVAKAYKEQLFFGENENNIIDFSCKLCPFYDKCHNKNGDGGDDGADGSSPSPVCV